MGLGVKAFINNDEILIGNIKLMSNNSVTNIPYEIINQAINLIISGEVINYKYDRDKKEIVKKDN
jgi:hypothetical protein